MRIPSTTTSIRRNGSIRKSLSQTLPLRPHHRRREAHLRERSARREHLRRRVQVYHQYLPCQWRQEPYLSTPRGRLHQRCCHRILRQIMPPEALHQPSTWQQKEKQRRHQALLLLEHPPHLLQGRHQRRLLGLRRARVVRAVLMI